MFNEINSTSSRRIRTNSTNLLLTYCIQMSNNVYLPRKRGRDYFFLYIGRILAKIYEILCTNLSFLLFFFLLRINKSKNKEKPCPYNFWFYIMKENWLDFVLSFFVIWFRWVNFCKNPSL